MYRTALLPAVLLVPLTLAGCGGSHSSTSSSTDLTATVLRSQTPIHGTTSNYTITIVPTGAASYTQTVNGVAGQGGSATLPAAQAAKFFQDLAAAKPLSALPVYDGPVTGIAPASSSSLIVQYQGSKGHIDDPADVREKALSDDVAAIAQTLGLPAP